MWGFLLSANATKLIRLKIVILNYYCGVSVMRIASETAG